MPNWDITRGDKVRMRRLPTDFVDLSAERQQVLDLCLGRVFDVRGLDDHGLVELDITRITVRERLHRIDPVFIDADCLELLDR